jgi:hypothetical protein
MINKNLGYHEDTQTANFSDVRPGVLVGCTNVSRNMRPPPSQLRYRRSPTYRTTWCGKSEEDNVASFSLVTQLLYISFFGTFKEASVEMS